MVEWIYHLLSKMMSENLKNACWGNNACWGGRHPRRNADQSKSLISCYLTKQLFGTVSAMLEFLPIYDSIVYHH